MLRPYLATDADLNSVSCVSALPLNSLWPLLPKFLSLPSRVRAVPQRQARLPPLRRFPVSPPLPICLQNQWRHGLRHPRMLVNRHKRHIRRRRMLPLSRHRILRKDLDAHLHRSMKNAVDLRLQIHNLAQIHRVPKINVVHRRRHHIAVRMPVRRQRCSHVNKVHHLSAEKFPQRISHRRQNDFRHLRTRGADWLPRQLRLKLPPTSFFPLHSSLHFPPLSFLFSVNSAPSAFSVLILVFPLTSTADFQLSLPPS